MTTDEIKFAVVPDPAHDCKPLATLSGMLESGALPTFAFLWGLTDGGDCHEIAEALSNDLTRAGHDDWQWITADCKPTGHHSWLECNGWAVDASNGKTRPVLIQRASDYRRAMRARRIRIV